MLLLRCVLALALVALWESWRLAVLAQSKAPSTRPSRSPTKSRPSLSPRSSRPSKAPTYKPSKRPTKAPSSQPTKLGQASPTVKPTKQPTENPTKKPTRAPSARPSKAPTSSRPTRSPVTKNPTRAPTTRPSKAPTSSRPSFHPSLKPTRKPTRVPTKAPNTCIPVETCTPTLAHCACDGTCKTTYKDCNLNLDDGCEVDSSRDLKNCGTCGNVCTTGLYQVSTTCTLGVCKYVCTNQFQGNCDNNIDNGCETAIFSNQNCGACGVQCSAPQTCLFDNAQFKYRCMVPPDPEPYY